MKSSKYSVLLMRDDRNVRRFRLSPAWFKIFIYFLILLIFTAAGGLFAGIRYWRINQELATSNRTLERNLIEAQVKLERLQNVEQILKQNDPEEMQDVIGTMSIDDAPVEPPPPPIDLSEIFTATDLGLAGVENLQLKFNADTARVSFDLNNLQSGSSLSGQIYLSLVLKSGQIVTVSLREEDLSFAIQRFKTIRTTVNLPEGVDANNVFGLKLTIKDPDGKIIFSETYPLYRILA